MASIPDVSVVIPTRNRPSLLARAVRSALAQTLRGGLGGIEVIVVVDGPDPATMSVLAELDDPRVRVVQLDQQGGAPNARNTGVAAARAQWTALLDDDDEWYPDKLAVQLELARHAGVPMPIVTCRLHLRTPRADLLMPRRLPADGEPLSEYFSVRRGLFHGEGFIQTSTILAPTELLRRVPFTVGLRRCQELDWALRALDHDGVDLVVAEEPLVAWYADENRARISHTSPWEDQFAWLQRTRPLVTRRAYAALSMSVVSSMAATTHSPRVFAMLLRDALRYGRPGLLDYVTFLQVWLLPPQVRRGLRDLVLGRRRVAEPASSSAAAAGLAV